MLAHGLMVMDALGRMRPAVSRLTGSLLAPMDGEKGQPQEENADGTEVEDRGRDGSMDAIAHACRLTGDAPILLTEAKTLVGALPAGAPWLRGAAEEVSKHSPHSASGAILERRAALRHDPAVTMDIRRTGTTRTH